MGLNIRRLRSAVNWVKKQDENPSGNLRWDQGNWFAPPLTPDDPGYLPDGFCGTACCVAGYLVDRFGRDEFRIGIHEDSWLDEYDPIRISTGERVNWEIAAAEVLGLEPRDSDGIASRWHSDAPKWETILSDLFEGNNDADDVIGLSEELAEYFGKTL
jgi:hypothetical protein